MFEAYEVENVDISLDVCKKNRVHSTYTAFSIRVRAVDTGAVTPCGHSGSFYTTLRTL